MKTLKTLSLLVLFSFIAFGSSYAQTKVETWETEIGAYVVCDDYFDFVEGLLSIQGVTHTDKDGNVDWFQYYVTDKGLVSMVTGEVTKYVFSVGKNQINH